MKRMLVVNRVKKWWVRFVVFLLGAIVLTTTICIEGCGNSNTPISQSIPIITVQPQNITVTSHESAIFSVTVTGYPNPTYQWNLGGTAIPGAVSASYTTPPTSVAMNGESYTVTVTNSLGSVTSSAAILTVNSIDTNALYFNSLPSGVSVTTNTGSYLVGFEFTANRPIIVTQLGFYDSNLSGNPETFAPTLVGLYDITTATLMGSVTVQSTSTPSTIFRYAPLDTPLELNTSDIYAAVAVTGNNNFESGFNYTGQLSSSLTWLGFARYGVTNLVQTSVLVEPNYNWTTTGYIGPNIIFY